MGTTGGHAVVSNQPLIAVPEPIKQDCTELLVGTVVEQVTTGLAGDGAGTQAAGLATSVLVSVAKVQVVMRGGGPGVVPGTQTPTVVVVVLTCVQIV